ncbi:hypothetical protein DW920_14435 [Clostridium sp. AM42-36]|nr:hypothetical protein DW920_14435 [Clostridium sp. AM42-36]
MAVILNWASILAPLLMIGSNTKLLIRSKKTSVEGCVKWLRRAVYLALILYVVKAAVRGGSYATNVKLVGNGLCLLFFVMKMAENRRHHRISYFVGDIAGALAMVVLLLYSCPWL